VTKFRSKSALLAATAVIVAIGCSDATAPIPVAQLDLSADSVLLLGGAAGQARVVAYDSAGQVIGQPEIHWEIRDAFPFSSVPANPPQVVSFDSTTGAITALRTGRVWLVAFSGTLRDSAFVSAERPVASLDMWLDTLEMAPGAAFGVTVHVAQSDQYILDSAWEGRWYSSNPAVAQWQPSDFPAYMGPWGPKLVALAPGTTTLTVSNGGASASRQVRVRDPGPLTLEETGLCGLNAEGELWCKGDDTDGILATETATLCSRSCSQQGANTWVHGARGMHFSVITTGVRASFTHRCGISRDDARAYCWGFNHDIGETVNRLAGPSGATTFCHEGSYTSGYQHVDCSFVPLAVDRTLDHQLIFRTIKAVGSVTCGTTGAPGAPEEIWCWGDAAAPTQRSSYPTWWPAT